MLLDLSEFFLMRGDGFSLVIEDDETGRGSSLSQYRQDGTNLVNGADEFHCVGGQVD
jgi:hypothetical protein